MHKHFSNENKKYMAIDLIVLTLPETGVIMMQNFFF